MFRLRLLSTGRGHKKFIACDQSAEISNKEISSDEALTKLPQWARTPARKELTAAILAPSKLADDEEAREQFGSHEPIAYSPLRSADKYLRGRTLHKLLELLPPIPDEERPDAADKLLLKLASKIDENERARWRDEVLHVLRDDIFRGTSSALIAVRKLPSPARRRAARQGRIYKARLTAWLSLMTECL